MSARHGLGMLEILIAGVIVVLVAVPAVTLLVSSRQGIAASWNETVARNLAAEALEWGATLPLDGLSGPILLEETPVSTIQQSRLNEGSTLESPVFTRDVYAYPEGHKRFFRRLEVSDASPAPGVPLLKLTATVVWAEAGSPNDRIRSVQLWRLVGP